MLGYFSVTMAAGSYCYPNLFLICLNSILILPANYAYCSILILSHLSSIYSGFHYDSDSEFFLFGSVPLCFSLLILRLAYTSSLYFYNFQTIFYRARAQQYGKFSLSSVWIQFIYFLFIYAFLGSHICYWIYY